MGLRFSNIHHRYGDEAALSGIDLEAPKGDILCLLGQSGCGKTTLLNLTAGVLRLQTGEISLGDKILASSQIYIPPEKRPVGLVFQDGALFPHLTVAENIGFGLRDRNSKSRIIGELLEQIGLSGFGDRYPHTLSGGQKQRVAVARALAPEPAVLLLDEPFASIDIMLRRKLREEIRQLLKARNCTTILVTHDPEEAVEVADKIAVMEAGTISQYGSAEDLYRAPSSLLVGLMAGEGSVLTGRWKDGAILTPYGHVSGSQLTLAGDPQDGDPVQLLLRPHTVDLVPLEKGAQITDLRKTGHSQIVTLQVEGHDPLLLEISPTLEWAVGQRVEIKAGQVLIPAFHT